MKAVTKKSAWQMLLGLPLAVFLPVLWCQLPQRVEAFQPQAEAAVPPPQSPAASSAEALHLLAGRSLVISSPARIVRVSIADPAVLDALVVFHPDPG